LDLIETRMEQIHAKVDMYKVLGGGWESGILNRELIISSRLRCRHSHFFGANHDV